MGGEKCRSWLMVAASMGSPPRGRGKDLKEAIQMIKMGITPAWAGKSCIAFDFSLDVEDHPRVGGEKTKKIP